MPAEYAVEFDGDEYAPIPKPWLAHPSAADVREGESEHRLYAVSAAVVTNRCLRVRYAHPGDFQVLRYSTGAIEGPEAEGSAPAPLRESGNTWARSLPPAADQMDVLRQAEIEHFYDLWGDELGQEGSSDEPAITAGGCVDGLDLSDFGVAVAGGLFCQNFDVHDEEVTMVSGPYESVQWPEYGRMAGGGPPLDIPYVDNPGTLAGRSMTGIGRGGGDR